MVGVLYIVLSPVVSHPSGSRTVHNCDEISLTLPRQFPGPRTPEPRSKHVLSGGSPASWEAIQSNAMTIREESPTRPVKRWVQAHGSPQSTDDEYFRPQLQRLNGHAGNVECVSQPGHVARSPTIEESDPDTSYYHCPDCTSNRDGVPAGDWALGTRTINDSCRAQDIPQSCSGSEPPRSRNPANTDGSQTIRAPPPATRPMPIRPNDAAKENEEYGYRGFGRIARSA